MLKRTALLLAAFAAACGATSSNLSSGSATLAITGATVVHPGLDGGAATESDRTVLIAGDRIVAVGPSASTPVPPGAQVVDGHGKWVIPGLVDSHVHFFQSANPFTRPDVVDFTDTVPYAKEVARNKARLPVTFKVWLASGVTSVVDCGGPFWNFEVRDKAQHSDAAPRVEIAGPLVSFVDRPQMALDDPPIIKVTTAEEALALVAKEIARKPDFIKVWFIHTKEGDLAKEESIVRAVAEATHAAHIRLLVHATELPVAKAALRAGADVLVHSVFNDPVDDEFIGLLKQRNAILLPTLWVGHGYVQTLTKKLVLTDYEKRLADPEILAQMGNVPRIDPRIASRVISNQMLQNLAKLWAAGVTIALGTDAGNIGTFHGPGVSG